jgi:hypothetical protein
LEAVRTYLLSLAGAALLCGIIHRFLTKGGAAAQAAKLLTALFLAITVLQPLTRLSPDILTRIRFDMEEEIGRAVAQGTEATEKAMAAHIKSKTEAYILEKAQDFGADITVEVGVTKDALLIPCSVTISGTVAPLVKIQLQQIIDRNLGIPKERQIWI